MKPTMAPFFIWRQNKGQIIRFSFVAGEQNHAPALMLNDEIIIIDKPIELEKWINVSLNLRQKDNVIEIEYDKKKMSSTFPLARNKQRNDYIRPDARLSGGSSPCQLKGYQHHTGRQTDKRMEIMET